MLRYIMIFVLVTIMVETKAQTPWGINERDDIMLLRISNTASPVDVEALQIMIDQDIDFNTSSSGNNGYLILTKSTSSTVTKQVAISRYMNENAVAYASFVYGDNTNDFFGIADDILVKLKPEYDESDILTFTTSYGLTSIDFIQPDLNVYRLFFDKTNSTINRLEALVGSGLFEYAEPNFFQLMQPHTVIGKKTTSHGECQPILQTLDTRMVDRSQWSMYTDEWFNFNNLYMQNSVNVNGNQVIQTGDEWSDINVCHAWTFEGGSMTGSSKPISGAGIRVAVIDDGVDADHYDLNIAMSGGSVLGYDAAPRNTPINTHPGAPDLGAVHGTACAGIIAAKRNNQNQPFPLGAYQGITGVAFDAEIVPVRITSIDMVNGNPVYTWTVAEMADGIMWAADNADVLSNSWGGGNNSPGAFTIEGAIDYAVQNGRGGKGSIVVFSTGNRNCGNIDLPSSHSEVIAVGAMSMCNQRKSGGAPILFPPNSNPPGYCAGSNASISCDGEGNWGSNYGYGFPSQHTIGSTTYTHNTEGKLSVVAPGVKIVTTGPDNSFIDYFNGTSSACPHVSAVAALMLSINSCLTYQEVKDVIELSAEKITVSQNIYPYSNYNYSQDIDNYFKYWNDEVGHGKLNAGNAVTLAHDIYKQAIDESGTETYHSPNYIYAGANVTDIYPSIMTCPPGLGCPVVGYRVLSGANVTFNTRPSQASVLLPGFVAELGSEFLADPNVPISCDNNDHHYKPSKSGNNDNIIVTKPQMGGADDLISNIKIYPNPAQETINIEFWLDEHANVSFVMSNVVGQRVHEYESSHLTAGKQKKSMSLQGLASGVYFVGIKTPSGYSQFRFIKN